MKIKFFLLSLVILFVLFTNTESKFLSTKFNTKKIIKNGFEYLTKFGMNVGTGAYKVRFKLERKINKYIENKLDDKKLELDFLVLLDREYEKIDNSMTCEQKYEFVQKKQRVTLKTDGSWTDEIKNTLSQSQRQHMWYFALGGCGNGVQIMEKYGFQVIVEFTALNSDETQFSSEESGMLTLFTFTFLGCLGGIAYIGALYMKMKERDWAILYLITSLVLLFFQAFFYFLHLTFYSYDGQGSFFFRFFSALSSSASQIVITLLLVQLAWGWTITYEQIPDKEVIIPLFVSVTVVDLLIMGLGFVNDGSDLKYHNYSGWVGITIIIIRLIIFAYFAYSLNNTLNMAREKIQAFGRKLQFFGSVYFLSLPIAVLIGSMLAYYLQHRFITITNLGFQIFAIIFLALNFLSKDSGYQKVAMKNRTELPSGFGSKFE